MEVELEGAMHVIAYMVPSGMREAMEAKYVAEPLLLGYGGLGRGRWMWMWVLSSGRGRLIRGRGGWW